MILAAGLGSRLRPLTDDRPKALVEVAGRTMLEITLERLRSFGIHDVIVNVHHFAEMVVEYLRSNSNFGMRIAISREKTLLDTGGGLKNAAWFFLDGERSNHEPFLVHNVDILSNFNLDALLAAHQKTGAVATLAVQRRETSRLLLFDHLMQLRGRQSTPASASERETSLAFAGIHILSPALLSMMTEEGAFSIIDTYSRLAANGERIIGYRDDAAYWCDLGKPLTVAKASEDLASGAIKL